MPSRSDAPMMPERDKTEPELVQGLRDAGLGRGDLVFVHLNLEALDPYLANQPDGGADRFFTALRQVIGAEGTVLVPTYTFSFCRQEGFNVKDTPTPGGPWSPSAMSLEAFRSPSGVHPICRSDPLSGGRGAARRAAAF